MNDGETNGQVDAQVSGDDLQAKPVALWRELQVVPEMMAFPVLAGLSAIRAPRGSSRPVLVLPGFIGSDYSTVALRGYLSALGHHPHGWGIGRNVGPANHIVTGVDSLLVKLADRYEGTIDIVGWSLGGVFGRMLAFNRPELVNQVISLGSPIRLQRDQSNVNGLFELMGSWWRFSASPKKLDIDKIPVPSTAVWTRSDGVVPGPTCRQTPGPTAETIEVRGSHCGLIYNSAVLRLVADRLAQPEGEWRPFEPSAGREGLYPSIQNHLSIDNELGTSRGGKVISIDEA